MTDKHCPECKRLISSESKYCKYCGSDSSANVYPSFWIRLGSYVIDVLGMVVGAFFLGIIITIFGGDTDLIDESVLGYFSYVIYSTLCLVLFSTTFGKAMYGLSVVDESGNRLDLKRSLIRSLLQPFSTIFFGIGYINIKQNKYGQAWHDKIAGTIVLRKDHSLMWAYVFTFIGVCLWVWLSSL